MTATHSGQTLERAPIVGEHISVRVLGIDTPELRGKCQTEKEQARKAKQFTASKLRGGNIFGCWLMSL